MLNFIKYIFSFIIIFSPIVKGTAIEMDEEDIILLKNIAKRSYTDATFDRGAHQVDVIQESLDQINWTKRPFRTARHSPSSVGAVYYSNNPPALIVAFHGSWWLKDWIDDFKAAQRPASELSMSLTGKVHQGFSTIVQESYIDMIDKIKQSLGRNLNNNDKIYFTGHSLGGALAMLAGTVVSFENDFDRNCIKIVTFSTPRGVIGDGEFVQQASQKLSLENILSFSTKGDVVPYLPQKLAAPIFGKYETFGINIEISPTEKVLSHYKDASVPRDIDDLLEHPARPMVELAATSFFWKMFGKKVGLASVAAEIGAEYFIVFHALPADEVIKKAFRYTQCNYRNSSSYSDKVGSISLGSIQRNTVLNSIYSFFV